MKDFAKREIAAALAEISAPDRVQVDAPMCRHTTFRLGGAADVLWLPSTAAEIAAGLRILRRAAVPVTVLGNGSNVIVRDGGIRGVVLALGKAMSDTALSGDVVTAQAGAMLAAVAKKVSAAGLTGMEFATGIPGSVGGAVYMNAGAYDGEIKNVVVSVEAITRDGEYKTYKPAQLDLSYRHSVFMGGDEIIVAAAFQLRAGDRAAIDAKVADFTERRRSKQPLELPSAGSTFKRPPGYFAGTLIEQAGLKGFSVGGAQVSEKHAGFVVNRGGATASDVIALMKLVDEKVFAAKGVHLEPEVRIIGED